jgi:hypothetical protein
MPEVLKELLRDHTTQNNIFWATHDYESLGKGFNYKDEILPERVTREYGEVIMPRVLKSKKLQTERSKDMAEVFTPSWVCNAQNNLVDEAWFGRKDVFNVENPDTHTWETNPYKITFPEGKTWKDYVRATRMEMTCGEGPYLVSRYDTTTGETIPVKDRIGLLDRKLRVVSENVDESGEWLEWAQKAFMNVYGFEWQGDNLLLAREALLYTFIEFYQEKFDKDPLVKSINYIAYIISWNIWQMDGLKGVVPDSCHEETEMIDLFSGEGKVKPCQGCVDGGYYHHNGIYCLLRDWGSKDPVTKENNRKIRFIDLIKQ